MESLEAAIAFLESTEGLHSIERDPYWPKWDGPWWHMLLLHEMGMAKRIPAAAIEALIRSLDSNCLHVFPFRESDVPPGKDPIRGIPCHCQLGTVYQVLTANGVEVDVRLPWIRPWFLKYQMQDGGLNCDEAAYVREQPKSSIVSTLPSLEAVLYCTPREFTAEEIEFLDSGAQYLIGKRLFRSQTDQRVLDEKWLRLCFPRFYHYDILRGLNFLLRWSMKLERPLPSTAIKDTIEQIEHDYPDDRLYIRRSVWDGAMTWRLNEQTNDWQKVPAKPFPLLEEIGELGTISPYLSGCWYATKKNLATLLDKGLIVV